MENSQLPYPKFYSAMLRTNVANVRNGKTKFIVDFQGPIYAYKSYEYSRYSFFIPAKFLHAEDSYNATIGNKIHDILRSCALNEFTDCWAWAGQKNGSYPSTYFLGKPRGAMKVLLALLTGADPEDFQTRRLCDNAFCINPRHHQITCSYNIPVDPVFISKKYGIPNIENASFWSMPSVLPWQRSGGTETLTREEIAQLPSEERKTFLPPLFSSKKEIHALSKETSGKAAAAEDAKWREVAEGKKEITFLEPENQKPITTEDPLEWIKDYNTVEMLEQLMKYLDTEEELRVATEQLEMLKLQELEANAQKKKKGKNLSPAQK